MAEDAASAGDGPDEEEVAEVGLLIEQLNGAIDAVNALEDEDQARRAAHAASVQELRCHAAAMRAESAGHSWQAAAVALEGIFEGHSQRWER